MNARFAAALATAAVAVTAATEHPDDWLSPVGCAGHGEYQSLLVAMSEVRRTTMFDFRIDRHWRE